MLNEELFEMDDKTKRISYLERKVKNLQNEINAFKAYDEKRKNYYAVSLRKLGELETFIQEFSRQ